MTNSMWQQTEEMAKKHDQGGIGKYPQIVADGGEVLQAVQADQLVVILNVDGALDGGDPLQAAQALQAKGAPYGQLSAHGLQAAQLGEAAEPRADQV